MRTPIAIGLGAIAGALTRYYLNSWAMGICGKDFPWGILGINLSGCFLMGGVFVLATARIPHLSPELYAAIATGFLGSYTTFSSYGLDTLNLALSRSKAIALVYCLGSAIGGVLCTYLGTLCARWLIK
jgi:fluoride exporter